MARTKHRRGLGKRKREGEGEDEQAPRKKQETSRPEQIEYDEAVSMMDPSLISDHFAKALKKHSTDSTAIELEDKYVSARSIQDTTSFSEPHLAKNLPSYLKMFSDGEKELSAGEKSAPHTLIITSSGIRAADLVREVRILANGDAKVAKLFAKHMKLAESVAFVEKSKISIAVSTPQRPKQLIEQNTLKLHNLRRIVIDGSYVDDKKRSIFDMSEVFLPAVELLNIDQLKKRLDTEEDPVKILVF